MKGETMGLLVSKRENALSVLTDNSYTTAKNMAASIGSSVGYVYTLVRKLREEGVGIIATRKGYILSEYAHKKDDVHFLRAINGRRTSDFIAMKAAMPDIKKRWRGDKQNALLLTMSQPLLSDKPLLDKSRNTLIKEKIKYSIK